jgi:type I restriction enzyme M protein
MNQEEINNVVWRACDTFRGTMDPSQYKDYILVILFLKYMSDVWKEKRGAYSKKYDGDKERVKRALSRERFIVPEEAEFDYLFQHREAPLTDKEGKKHYIGELINIAL